MSAIRTYVANPSSTLNATSYSFPSVALGTAAADRQIIVTLATVASTLPAPTVTVAGVTAVLIASAATTQYFVGIYAASVPTGTTGTVAVTIGASAFMCSCGVYALYGAGTTPADFGSSTALNPTYNLNVPAGGVAIGAALVATTSATWTWTNLTEDVDQIIDGLPHTWASAEFAAQQTGLTITATRNSGSAARGAFASWGPASGGGTLSLLLTDWW